jgi:hypothetical protein
MESLLLHPMWALFTNKLIKFGTLHKLICTTYKPCLLTLALRPIQLVFHHFLSLVVVRYLFLVYRLRFHRFSALVICISRRLTLLQLRLAWCSFSGGQLFLQQLHFFICLSIPTTCYVTYKFAVHDYLWYLDLGNSRVGHIYPTGVELLSSLEEQ